jgi:hypothetical protein
LLDNRAAVRAMIDWSKSRSAMPVLLVTPVSRAYAAAENAEELGVMRAELARLHEETGVKVADYMNDARFTDDDFYDFDHLDRDGAVRFTRLLRSEVIEPALAGN